MYNYYNLILFVLAFIFVVIFIQNYGVKKVTYESPLSNLPDLITLDLKSPIHVIPNCAENRRCVFRVPDGRFDGDSITLLFDPSGTSNNPGNVLIDNFKVRFGSYTYNSVQDYLFTNFDKSRSIQKLVWINGAWNVDNNTPND